MNESHVMDPSNVCEFCDFIIYSKNFDQAKGTSMSSQMSSTLSAITVYVHKHNRLNECKNRLRKKLITYNKSLHLAIKTVILKQTNRNLNVL